MHLLPLRYRILIRNWPNIWFLVSHPSLLTSNQAGPKNWRVYPLMGRGGSEEICVRTWSADVFPDKFVWLKSNILSPAGIFSGGSLEEFAEDVGDCGAVDDELFSVYWVPLEELYWVLLGELWGSDDVCETEATREENCEGLLLPRPIIAPKITKIAIITRIQRIFFFARIVSLNFLLVFIPS